MKNRFVLIALAILSIGLLVTLSGRAQDGPQEQPQGQPQAPSAVGRLSVIHGNVSTMHRDGTEWAAGTVNTPIVPGDKVATADRARAEVQLDPANVLRLDQHTELQVADLEQSKINIQLSSGLVDFSVYRGTQADVEVDTPNMGVHPLAPGVYRIQVNSDSETLLIVRQGEAEVLTNQGSTKVEAGQVINIHGTDNPEYKIDPASSEDEFDKWCSDRNRQLMTVQSAQRQGPYQGPPEEPPYVGSSDLDAYGQWSEVPDQGWCWTPQVDAGWVPYTYGHYGWEPYWGWTWISAEPWGWAPYHYGSWFEFGGRWHWRPDHDGGGRGGYHPGNGWGNGNRWHGGGMNGHFNGNTQGFGGRSNSMVRGGQPGTRSPNGWRGYQSGNQSSRWPGGGNGPSTGWQGRNASAPQGNRYDWQRFASPNPYGGGRMESGPSAPRGGWQGYGNPSRNYSGSGAGASGRSYYGRGSRPPLELNRPIMRQRAPGSGYYGGGGQGSAPSGGGRTYGAPSGGGGRGYSAPSGGGRTYGAPSGGGGRGYSAPQGGGGGGRGSGGGGGGGGGGSHGGGGGHH